MEFPMMAHPSAGAIPARATDQEGISMISKYVLATLLAGCLAASGAVQAQAVKLRVAGNLLATGLIQQHKEQPFFENLAKTTGVPFEVD
jgi:hypothetical protein